MNAVDWLLDSDPAIRWQAMRDLTGAAPAAIVAERARIPHEGLGAAILACQASDGSWRRPGKPGWLPTLFTMQLLRATGVDPADPAVRSAVKRLDDGFRWPDEFREDKPFKTFFDGEVEPCINGAILALGADFGRPSTDLARRFIREQLDDGGWNCEAPKSTRSSYHTTICVLEGLLAYESAVGGAEPEITAARKRGEQYLLERALFKRRSTGAVADPAFLAFAYPPRYHYDILRALDYLRLAGAVHDERAAEATTILKSKQREDGRWNLDAAHDEALALPFPEAVGAPSRWNTLRALRVLSHHGTLPFANRSAIKRCSLPNELPT